MKNRPRRHAVRPRHSEAGDHDDQPTRAVPAAAPAFPAPPLVVALWYTAGIVTLWAFGYAMTRGSDLWWHLAAGDRMAQVGGFLYTDPWSFTFEGKPWLNDAWLSDRIYHVWVQLFGLQSLAWWKWSVLLAAYLLLMRTLYRVTGCLFSAYVGAGLAIAVGEPFLDIRPHLYSLLGTAVLLHLTLGRQRPSPWLPVLFLIWVQMHSIFVFGLVSLALLLLPSLLRGSPEERRRAVLIGVGCVLACLINPHGITVFTRPLRYTLTSSLYRSIGEWQPPFEWGPSSPPYDSFILQPLAAFNIRRVESGMYSYPYPYAIVVFLVACTLLLKEEAVPLMGIGLGALTLVMSLKSRRFVPLFGISQSIVLACMLAPWVRQAFGALKKVGTVRIVAPPLLALGLGLFWLWPLPLHSYAFHYMMAEDTFPIETLNFVTTNRIAGKVFAYYNWGGYLHVRTQGALKVYIDGRADMVFDDETYRRYVGVGRRSGWIETIEGSGAEYALWPKNDEPGSVILQGLLASGRWRLVYEDHVSKLLERSDRPLRQDYQPTPDSAWRELTLGSAAADFNRLAEAEAHYRRALELMPYLGAACFELAKVEARQGRIDEGRQTADHCDSIYPFPARHNGLISWLNGLAAQPGR